MSQTRNIEEAIKLIKPYTEIPTTVKDDEKAKGTARIKPLALDAVKKLEILRVKVDAYPESYGFLNEIIYDAVEKSCGTAGNQTIEDIRKEIKQHPKVKINKNDNDGWFWPLLDNVVYGLKKLFQMIRYGSLAGLVGAGAGTAAGIVVSVPAASAATVGAVAGVVSLAAARAVYSFFKPPKDNFIDDDLKKAASAIIAFQNQNKKK